MVFDCFPFFNELDMLKMRLNILWPVVDKFIISESTVTFSGKPKPLFFRDNREMFRGFEQKIIYNLVDDTPEDFASCGTKPYHTDMGANNLLNLDRQWLREIYQRDSLVDPLVKYAKEDDMICISDLDEIPDPELIKSAARWFKPGVLYTCEQNLYMYYLNYFRDSHWLGTRICDLGLLKQKPLFKIRTSTEDKTQITGPILPNAGWHFSFIGGTEVIKDKIRAYSHQEFNNSKILGNIEKNLAKGKDVLGRKNRMKRVEIDDSFPDFLVEHQAEYAHFILGKQKKKGFFSWFRK